MGRKRKNKNKETVWRPFCYYCDREFNDEKILMRHQKAKHFACVYCGKRLTSVNGLVMHVARLHKEVLTKLPGCKEGRDNLELKIVGMYGVPEDIVAEHYGLETQKKQKVEQVVAGNGPQQLAVPPVGVNPTIPQMPNLPTIPMNPMVPSMGMMRGFPGMNPYLHRPMMPYAPPYGMPPPMYMGRIGIPQPQGRALPPQPVYPQQLQPNQHQSQFTPQSIQQESKPKSVSSDVNTVFIFKGEHESMEELRAKLPRYRNTTEKSKQ